MRRRIHRAAGSTSTQVLDVLQTIFAGELLSPSRSLWLVSPWISDVGVIDNGTGGFTPLDAGWGYRSVRLSEVLSRLASLGTHVVVATRPDELNDQFVASLCGKAEALGASDRVTVRREEETLLHEKGLLSDRCYVAGSMNFTYRGVTMNEELLTVSTAVDELSEVRLTYFRRWGGVL